MRLIPFIILFLCAFNILDAQDNQFSPDRKLGIDPKVTTGHLDNGLTYFIRKNEKPENRAQLWLVVNAGSILEDADQLGLAHFTEHMAFNGTKHFEKQELVSYLESIGMQFGPEINAYTGFDETVFMLQVPTDSIELMEKGFLILEDWAHGISFEDEEIDKERGVVIEEWRLGRGADMRMMDKQLPVIFKGSKYAERLPIGTKKILEEFEPATIRRFYRDWYRPDLMAVIAVGDFNEQWIEEKIKDHFSRISLPHEIRERATFEVPDHKETLFALATDPEATYTVISVYYKSNPVEAETVGGYKMLLMEQLFSRMFNQRLYELLNTPEPPFLVSYAGKGDIVRTKSIYSLNAAVVEGGVEKGLEALLTEAQRVQEFGFTKTELERSKTKIIRQYQQAFDEREKSESSSYAGEYSRHFLENEPIPGIEFEYEMAMKLVPEISLDEVNALLSKWITEHNRVILLSGPEKGNIPDESELLSVFKKVEMKEITAYDDGVSDAPLLQNIPEPVAVTDEKTIESLGVTEWTLENGVKVILKPTDFKNDEILFQSYSPGGTSLASNEDYISANMAVDVVTESGLGKFGKTEFNKKISDKIVTVFPYVNSLDEGFTGNSSVKDIETMFQLIYLYMTQPRLDSAGFLSYQARMKGFIENRSANPETAFYDTLMVTMAQHNPRVRPWSEELLDEMDMKKSYEFYLDRFADASDYTFFLVGSFDLEMIRPLVTTYLGNLPSISRKENWKDTKILPPKGVLKKQVFRGIEPKSRVNITFSGPMEYSRENLYILSSMTSFLRIKLRELLREDLGGTYGVSIGSSGSKYPREEYRVVVNFGCSPGRVEEMISNVFLVMDTLKTLGPEEDYLLKVKEMQKRSYETNMKENGYWLRSLYNSYYMGTDPELIYEYPALLETLKSNVVKEAANQYLNTKNYVQLILYPEKE